ncbi:hypothetical protein TNCV_412021 [Trichonephila clavipes]|uniref:Uncharacterized protein n=1 Tax=Trichonephila clavipes TaxID=2585209 RepID=A0A8X6S2U1_TRICX|nr:hypothetical protein TNCV_412021 [Trichonephila clavipes]
MIWAKCPKEIFVNKRRVKRAVTEAVCEYNKGTVRTIVETQKALGVATGGSTKQLATILDCRKQKFRKRRQNAMVRFSLKLLFSEKKGSSSSWKLQLSASVLEASFPAKEILRLEDKAGTDKPSMSPVDSIKEVVPGKEADDDLAGKGCDLSNLNSTILTHSEIPSFQRNKMNLTWRNPPAPHW